MIRKLLSRVFKLPERRPKPKVFPFTQHGVRRESISPAALKITSRLQEAGFAAFVVGGAVRDLLLGQHPKDFDVATNATPEQVHHLFRRSRIIGRRFRIVHVMVGAETIEVTTFRGGDDTVTDSEGRILNDNVFGSQEEDARRRDFTVNALFYNPSDETIVDYHHGVRDVHARKLAMIGNPVQRYREDPGRMLRAVRLAAKLDFSIEAATAQPLPGLAPLLGEAAPARLFEEMLKLFLSGHAVASFQGLEAHGLLAALLPETAAALRSNRSGALRRMVLAGLRNTDARVAADEPVSPAFLFALLLWPAYCRTLAGLQAQGMHVEEAQRRAADRVTLHQVQVVALPKRFSLPMQEIWLLQSRFSSRQPKRVQRLQAHPRFRAAWDFLVLRLAASDAHAADVEFWRQTQQASGAAPPAGPVGAEGAEVDRDAVGEDAPPRRRRRRRSPAPTGG